MDNTESLEMQLQRVKDNLTKVKSTIKQLDTYLVNFESIREKLDDPEDGLENNLVWSTDKKNQITNLYSEANTTLENLRLSVEQTSEKITSVEQLIESARSNTDQSQTIKQEISELKSTANEYANSISALLNQSQESFNTINTLLDTATSNIEKINQFMETFNELKGRVEDEENGFEAVIQIVNENLEQSNTLLKQIEIARNNSNKNLLEIEQEKTTILGVSKEIKTLKDNSIINKKEIDKLLDIASDASFADSFNKRKKELSGNANFWKWVYLGAIILLVAYLLSVFWNSIYKSTIPGIEASVFRLALSSPIIFLIFFSGLEYGKNRDNEEKYAFKFATSSIFRNHIKFLLANFGKENTNEVLQTTQKIVDMLYTPTYAGDDKLSKIEKNILNNFLNNLNKSGAAEDKLLDIDNLLEKTKKVKEIIGTDQDLMKTILPFIFK